MSDLEARLRDTLSERAGAAPDALGLATGARRRLRRRRTTWAVAAAAVVAAGVPLGLDQLGPSSDGGGRVADEPTATSGLPPGVIETGYRAESWHDVTFEVPVDWGYGGTSGWCAGGGAAPVGAVVARPDTVVPAIACSPANGYGVTVGPLVAASFDPARPSGDVWQYDAADADVVTYPDGTWLGFWYDDDAIVTVATPDRAETRRLVDSVQRFTGVDPHDCPATLGEAEAATITEPYATFSSPRRTADYDCPTEDDLSRIALLSSGGYVATAVTEASCPGWNGLFRSGVVQDLTPEALRHLDLSQLPVPPEE
jgi:hypothetical protein